MDKKMTQAQAIYFSAEQKFGYSGELFVADKLKELGYDVYMPPDFSNAGYDILVNGILQVEVKISGKNARVRGSKVYQKYAWKLCSVDTSDRVLVLIAEDSKGLRHSFVMPGAVMGDRLKFEINSHPTKYGGIIAPFLECWDVVDFLLKKRYKDVGQKELEIFCKET